MQFLRGVHPTDGHRSQSGVWNDAPPVIIKRNVSEKSLGDGSAVICGGVKKAVHIVGSRIKPAAPEGIRSHCRIELGGQ